MLRYCAQVREYRPLERWSGGLESGDVPGRRRESQCSCGLLNLLVERQALLRIGTPESVADDFQEWFESGAADGFNVMFSGLHQSITDFSEGVVPELQRRGLFRRE